MLAKAHNPRNPSTPIKTWLPNQHRNKKIGVTPTKQSGAIVHGTQPLHVVISTWKLQQEFKGVLNLLIAQHFTISK
jgi:hypothetical protein